MHPTGAIFERPKLERPIRYAISDRRLFPSLTSEAYLDRLTSVTATVIQLREKDLEVTALRRLVELGLQGARRRGKLFIVNSDTRLAAEAGADGVHLPSTAQPETARRMADEAGRPELLIGWSTHSVHEIQEAETRGVDYVLLAPIFRPISKQGRAPLGLGLLREACAVTALPVVALGGVTLERVDDVLGAGAAGFAGISWVADEIRAQSRAD